jgi:undecaprenyl-diphosphatase
MFIAIKKYWYLYTFMSIIVAFERIYTGSHFPSDVLAGAIIGIFLTYIIITPFKNKKVFKISEK